MYDICIIGGGASGMTAAIAAYKTNENIKICIVEKNTELGKKILATGNGRCNLSNSRCHNNDKVLGFLGDLGIVTRTDESGRIYPYSEQGAQVRDVLSVHAFASADVFLGDAAEHISSSDGLVTNSVETDSAKAAGKNQRKGFTVIMKSGRIIKTRTVILALGGKAGPQYGCTGDGYRLARNLGHRVTRLAPALSAVECKGAFKPIKGVRAKARVQLLKKIKMSGERLQDGKGRVIKNESNDVIAEESGEVQFTADGLSGICIFDLSRFIKLYDSETLDDGFKKYSLRVDLMPDISEDALREMLNEKIKIFSRRITENNAKRVIQCSHLKNKNASKKYNTQFKEKWCVLETIVNDKLAKMIFERVTDNMGTDKMYPNMIDVRSERAESFYAKEPVKLAKALASGIKDMRFQVSSVKGWRYAQCTSGGIPRVEVDMSTMESKIVKGLYIIGEMIDNDCPCGGFNLNNAWETGIKAGIASSAEAG